MKLKKKSKTVNEIPTASMPDIVFMLLIFFMVSTVLKQYSGLPVILPSAKQIKKLESRQHLAEVWVSKEGLISIDGKLINIDNVKHVMYAKVVDDPQTTVILKADKACTMELISKIHKELRDASALKVIYSAKFAP